MEKFKEIEPSLKLWFNIDRYTPEISKCISSSISTNQLMKTDIPEKYRKDNGNYDIFEYSFDHSDVIQMPISSSVNFAKIGRFFQSYNIEEDTIIYDTLSFMSIYYMTLHKNYNTVMDDIEYDFLQYAVGVRPEMLNLYIALHETTETDSIKIRFGNNKYIEVDTMFPWFRDEIKEYLHKYLGVDSIKDAKRELLMNYANKVGAPANWEQNQYIWGLYNLLEDTGLIKSKTKGNVSRKQAKFIEEYLLAIHLIKANSNIDANNIRSRLVSLFKNYDSIEEITQDRRYKSSPNNNGIRRY